MHILEFEKRLIAELQELYPNTDEQVIRDFAVAGVNFQMDLADPEFRKELEEAERRRQVQREIDSFCKRWMKKLGM